VDSCNFTNKANSHAFEVEIHTRQKLCHFGRYDPKAELFCQKSFVLVTGLKCSYGKDFEPDYRDLGNRASPASHMNTFFYEGKRGEARYRKPSQPGWPGSCEEVLGTTWQRKTIFTALLK